MSSSCPSKCTLMQKQHLSVPPELGRGSDPQPRCLAAAVASGESCPLPWCVQAGLRQCPAPSTLALLPVEHPANVSAYPEEIYLARYCTAGCSCMEFIIPFPPLSSPSVHVDVSVFLHSTLTAQKLFFLLLFLLFGSHIPAVQSSAVRLCPSSVVHAPLTAAFGPVLESVGFSS